MPTLSDDQINEIAEQLNCGYKCFWHKQTGELLFVPDVDDDTDNEWIDAELQQLEIILISISKSKNQIRETVLK